MLTSCTVAASVDNLRTCRSMLAVSLPGLPFSLWLAETYPFAYSKDFMRLTGSKSVSIQPTCDTGSSKYSKLQCSKRQFNLSYQSRTTCCQGCADLLVTLRISPDGIGHFDCPACPWCCWSSCLSDFAASCDPNYSDDCYAAFPERHCLRPLCP